MYEVTRYKRSTEKSKINSLVTHVYSYVSGRRGEREVTGSLHRGDDRFSGFPDGEGQGFQTKDAPRKPLPLQDHKFHCGIYLLLPTTVLIPKVITVQKTSCRTRRQDTIPAVCILFCFVFTLGNHTCTCIQDL